MRIHTGSRSTLLLLIGVSAALVGCGGGDDRSLLPDRDTPETPAALIASPVGSWFGRIVAENPGVAAFPDLTVLLTVFANGTVVVNDSREFSPVHGTGHGEWAGSGEQLDITYIWLNLSGTKPNGFLGVNKIRISGQVHPDDPNRMLGRATMLNFPEGTNPLDPTDAGSVPQGAYQLSNFRRINVGLQVAPLLGADLSNEASTGSWFGRAVTGGQGFEPFPALVIEPTFHADGNIIFSDSQEEATTHTTAHGQWTVTPDGFANATFLWLDTGAGGLTGVTRVSFAGGVDPADPSSMWGSFDLSFFPAGSDALDPMAAGQPRGSFDITNLTRFESPAANSNGRAAESTVGSWFGRAIPDDPATVPFPEVYMSPTFIADGTFIANDAIPSSLHHTAHGHWAKTGPGTSVTSFVFTLGNPMIPDGFGGAFRITFHAQVDSANPDLMSGFLQPVFFPPGTDPLDPSGTGGLPLGQLSFPELRRVAQD